MRKHDGQRGQPLHQKLQGEVRQRDPGGASGHRQHQALGQKLPHHAPESGAEGGADGHLLLPLHRAAQQQTAGIRAGDQQNQAHGCQDEQQGEFVVAGRLIAPRRNREFKARVALGIFLLQLLRHDGQGAAGPIRRHSRLEQRRHLHQAARAGVQPERNPHLGIGIRKLELRRHHPGHRVDVRVDGQGAADGSGIGVEHAPPQPVAEHRGIDRIPFVGREQRAAQLGANSEHGEQSGRDALRDHLIGFAGSGDRQAVALNSGGTGEQVGALPPAQIVLRVHARDRPLGLGLVRRAPAARKFRTDGRAEAPRQRC